MIYLLPALSLLMVAGWFISRAFRKPRNISDLRKRIDVNRADNLFPFLDTMAFNRDDEGLWSAMGQLPGLCKMCRDAGLVLSLAARIRETEPDCEKAAHSILCQAIYLRGAALLCLLEAYLHHYMPIPRLMARCCAYLYCDIAVNLEIVLSICDEGVLPTTT